MPPSKVLHEFSQDTSLRPKYRPSAIQGAGEHENIRNYVPSWPAIFNHVSMFLQAVMSKCGTSNNVVEMGQSERLRQAYVDAFAYCAHILSQDAIQGKRPEVDEMPYPIAILYFALSKSVKLVNANGNVVVCKFVKTDNTPTAFPAVPLGPPGQADLGSGFRTIGDYAPSNDLDTLRNGFRLITQRSKDVFTQWKEGQEAPAEVKTGSQFCWFVDGDDTGKLKGYNGEIKSEFPIIPDPTAPAHITKDLGLAHCAMTLGSDDYVPLYSIRTYVHPSSAFGWLCLVGKNRRMDHFPMPVLLDATEVVTYAAAIFEGVNQQYEETGQPTINAFHQIASVGGATWFAAYILRLLAMAFQEYQGLCFPSVMDGTSFVTLAQGTQNLPRDITSQAQDQFFKVLVELCRSLYATRHNHAYGVAHYIPICIVPDGLDEIVAAFTAWTVLPNADAVQLNYMRKVSSNQLLSFWDPYEGVYHDFIEAWGVSVSRYQNYVAFGPVTNQKEVFRKLGQFVRLKVVKLAGILNSKMDRRTFGQASYEARNRLRKVKGRDPVPIPEDAVWDQTRSNPGARHAFDADTLNNVAATGSFDGVMTVEGNRAFLALPMFFLPINQSDNLEREITSMAIRYGIPRITVSMEPAKPLYPRMAVSGTQQATDLANSKDGINEIIASLQYYDKHALGGALTFAADKIAARPALVKNPYIGAVIKAGAKVAEGLIGKTKIGKSVQGVAGAISSGNVNAGIAAGKGLVGAVKGIRSSPAGQNRIANRQLRRANRRSARSARRG